MENNHLDISRLWKNIKIIREKSPLVHNMTNYVVMNTTANALLSLGAAPIMSLEASELEELIDLCSALVINIGTLEKETIKSMLLGMEIAKTKGKPVVIDPVGSGATKLRTDTVKQLFDKGDRANLIIRGNASEIGSLASTEFTTKGVDSQHQTSDVMAVIESILKYAKVIVVSGEVDLVVDETHRYYLSNGHKMMAQVTGMGCTLSAIIGAFTGIEQDKLLSALQGCAVMGVIGEWVGEQAKGPGEFQKLFYDMLYLLDEKTVQERLKWQDKPYA